MSLCLCDYAEFCYTYGLHSDNLLGENHHAESLYHVMMSVYRLSVVMPIVVMANVVAPSENPPMATDYPCLIDYIQGHPIEKYPNQDF